MSKNKLLEVRIGASALATLHRAARSIGISTSDLVRRASAAAAAAVLEHEGFETDSGSRSRDKERDK